MGDSRDIPLEASSGEDSYKGVGAERLAGEERSRSTIDTEQQEHTPFL